MLPCHLPFALSAGRRGGLPCPRSCAALRRQLLQHTTHLTHTSFHIQTRPAVRRLRISLYVWLLHAPPNDCPCLFPFPASLPSCLPLLRRAAFPPGCRHGCLPTLRPTACCCWCNRLAVPCLYAAPFLSSHPCPPSLSPCPAPAALSRGAAAWNARLTCVDPRTHTHTHTP